MKLPSASSIIKKEIPVTGGSVKYQVKGNETSKKLTNDYVPKKSTISKDENSDSFGDNPMQIVQTDNGEILLLTGDINTHSNNSNRSVSVLNGIDDEVERMRAVKFAEIKEQQQKRCPICYKTALEHRITCTGTDQKFAYKCCHSECGVDNLKTARLGYVFIVSFNFNL